VKPRLLPAVFAIAAALLVLKGTDVTMEARAQAAAPSPAATTPAATTPAAAQSPSSDPADDGAATSSTGEVDVLTSLAKRRAELDAREQSLDLRENLIRAAEQRVDGKIVQLKQLQTQVEALLGQRDDAEKAQLAALVKTYSSMKPKDAARIFNNLNEDVLLSVASQMKPDVLGAIMAGMQADQAQKLTVRLADRLKVTQNPPQPAPQQTAALAPAAPLSPGAAPAAAPQGEASPPGATPVPQAAAPANNGAPAKKSP